MSTSQRGHFLTFETSEAGSMHERLLAAGIITDVRADRIRLGFGCYQTAEDIEIAVDAVSRALRHPSRMTSSA
jgi:kynureninase